MKSREGINMTQNNSHPRADEIERIALLLIAEWERVEPQEGKVNPSRIANFADMARVIVEDSDGCPVHAGQIHGGEAEELRAGIERIMADDYDDWRWPLRELLDEVDARDSLAHVQMRKEQRITIVNLAGRWKPCTGCHELNEGHPTGSWSGVFRCNLGNGCDECGGIGAVWERHDRNLDLERETTSALDGELATVLELRSELALAKGEISRMTMRPAAETLDDAREYEARLDVVSGERNRLRDRVAELESTIERMTKIQTELRDQVEYKTAAIHRNNDVIDKLEARILNAELAAFKDAVAQETIAAALKR